jgi:zinc protease
MTWLALLAVVLGTGVMQAPGGRAVPADTTIAYDASGLRVIHRAIPGREIVAVRLYLLGGTRQLTDTTQGIEALVLRAAAHEFGPAMARTGSRTILEPTADWTVTGFLGLTDDLGSAWAAFARMLTGPALAFPDLSNAAIGRAREIMLAAARRRYSHPDLRIHTIANWATFEGHPYALDPEGTDQSLAALDRAALERYALDQFVTSRMLLVIVANVSRTHVDSLVASTLGRLPRGDYRWTLPPPVPRRPSRWRIEQRALPTNYILGYFTGPDPRHRDYFAFYVASRLLSSRLQYAVRTERSLAYAAYGPFLDHAIPVSGLYASTSEPAEVYPLMLGEIRWLQYEGTGSAFVEASRDLSRFLDQFVLDQLAQEVTSDAQADALGRAELLFGDHRMADEFVRRLRRVNVSDVRRAATRYMRDIQFAFLGDRTRMHGRW